MSVPECYFFLSDGNHTNKLVYKMYQEKNGNLTTVSQISNSTQTEEKSSQQERSPYLN